MLGPSGSGKSTLLSILGALEPPTAGEVKLDGEDPFSLPPDKLAAFRNQKIGFVFQDHCLLPQCTVLENVLIPTLAGERVAKAREQALEILKQVGLSARVGHMPSQLSGGEKQRVAIARALIRNPLLLLCDEPTGNLDRRTAEAVSALLLDLHARWANILVVVTHNPALAAHFPLQFELADGRLIKHSGS